MADDPPDRVTFSIPPDDDLDVDVLDQLVEQSEHRSRSEYIRAAIKNDES